MVRLLLALAATVSQGTTQRPADVVMIMKAPPRALEVLTFTDPANRFSVEYPKKDWRLSAGGLSVLVSFTQKDGEARVDIEHAPQRRRLDPASIGDLFLSVQAEEIKEIDRLAADIKSRLITNGDTRIAVFEYTRQGGDGPEYARVYLFLRGLSLYRVVCRVKSAQLAKYNPVFAHIAATFAAKEIT